MGAATPRFLQESVKPKLGMDFSLLLAPLRIYSSLLTLLKEGKAQPSPECCVCHSTSSWEIPALEPGLQGLQIPHPRVSSGRASTASPVLQPGNDSRFCSGHPEWAITFSVSCPISRNRVGGAWERLGEGGTTFLIMEIRWLFWLLGYRTVICNIPKYSIKKDPKLRQCPAAPALMVETDFPHLLTSHPNPHLFNKQ